MSFRDRLYTIIFDHETPAGRAFDVILIVAIVASVIAVMLDSVAEINRDYGDSLAVAEWIFTILFTIEYLLRLYSARSALGYARSFFGVVDLLAILPTYLSILFPAGRFLLTIRVLRVLRIFRVLKLARFIGEASILRKAMMASSRKILVFLLTVCTIVITVGSLMYIIEGRASGFTSIPRSIYWAIVTLTTVGYGDIAPQTPIGQTLAALLMVTGYGIIAVPTGIVTVELGREAARIAAEERDDQQSMRDATGTCSSCGRGPHESDAAFCKHCGAPLRETATSTHSQRTGKP